MNEFLVNFEEYLLERPELPDIFGFNPVKTRKFLWRNITSDFRDKGTLIPIVFGGTNTLFGV